MNTIKPSKILIPKDIDMQKWACVACDQFTSEREYWENLKNYVGDEPSTLKMIFPEAYLNDGDEYAKIERINATMEDYLRGAIDFEEYNGYILTIRTMSNGKKRIGLMMAIDLDDYSYQEGSKSKIRCSEATVLERIEAREKVREDAPMELPHVMLLADDSEYAIIEEFYNNRENYKKIYDFDLNMDGGHIEGYYIPDSVNMDEIFDKIEKDGILFSVGDGNHSLAAAKACYENSVSNSEKRYALCEVVDIYSESLNFEPIHRLLTDINVSEFLEGMRMMIGGMGYIGVTNGGNEKILQAPEDVVECYEAVQGFIDMYIARNGGKVDYIHGLDSLKKLASEDGALGIIMPSLKKEDFFRSLAEFGSFPRKTFSMGEAREKRYYLEARKLK